METISSEEFRVAVRFKLIKKIRIEQTKDFQYLTHLTLAKEDQEKTVITQRGEPKEWANLDRLIKHIQSNKLGVTTIILTLYEQTETNTE